MADDPLNDPTSPSPLSAAAALERLRAGNRRFVTGQRDFGRLLDQAQREGLANGQQPFAVILGCSDSRVPVEIVFDQGLGDLFVIRVAGNIVAPSQIGSVEFAVEAFGIRLVVVLGHSGCGAVRATLDSLRQPAGTGSPHLDAIVDRIRPAVAELVRGRTDLDDAALARHAVRANVRVAVNALRHGSRIIEDLVSDHGLVIAGAQYSLETGQVEFLEN